MRGLIKKVISGYPWLYERLLDLKYLNIPLSRSDDMLTRDQGQASSAAIFTEKYSRNSWGDSDSRSGAGSNLHYTHEMRDKLERFLLTYSISSMLDAPCGDFVW